MQEEPNGAYQLRYEVSNFIHINLGMSLKEEGGWG